MNVKHYRSGYDIELRKGTHVLVGSLVNDKTVAVSLTGVSELGLYICNGNVMILEMSSLTETEFAFLNNPDTRFICSIYPKSMNPITLEEGTK